MSIPRASNFDLNYNTIDLFEGFFDFRSYCLLTPSPSSCVVFKRGRMHEHTSYKTLHVIHYTPIHETTMSQDKTKQTKY